jgi:hypothetical protein
MKQKCEKSFFFFGPLEDEVFCVNDNNIPIPTFITIICKFLFLQFRIRKIFLFLFNREK